MKKRSFSIALALVLCLGLMVVPASAYDMGKVGEWNVISAGDGHTAAIDADGSLWMWGQTKYGELGNGGVGNVKQGYDEIQTVPVKVMEDVAAVSCGMLHTAAVKTDGSLWTWGTADVCMVGFTGKRDRSIPMKAMDNVAAVSCDGHCMAVVKTDGSLWTWGMNNYYQLGSGSKEISWLAPVEGVLDNVAAVSCGDIHATAMKTDGTVWTWGSNLYGQLGNGGGGDIKTGRFCQSVPIQISLSATAALTAVSAPQTVLLDGEDVVLPAAYQINGANYVKLRDLATVLSGTAAQFDVGWVNSSGYITLTTGKAYKPLSGDMTPIPDEAQGYRPCASDILLNGEKVELEAYTIDGNNYFKLRDLGRALGFNVSWNGSRVVIAPDEPYSDAQ